MRCLGLILFVISIVCPLAESRLSAQAPDVRAIGSRLEPLVDDFLIEKLSGDAAQRLVAPEPAEMVFVADQPWEGNTSAYFTIFPDGERFRMYYRGAHYDVEKRAEAHPEVTCYAESDDGVHWTKPELGLVAFNGSTANNIVWEGVGAHNFTPFKDTNPQCPPEAQYKALASGTQGLIALQSADGLRWTRMSEMPVITKGAFDSQNLGFWDPNIQRYRDYHRGFRAVRDIMTCTSADFLTWTEPEFLNYTGAPQEHLYTNAIRVYDRAPHLYLGFPTRFLPPREQTEPTFMTSRDGQTFHRWSEAVIPVTAPEDRAGNRSNYLASALLHLPGDDRKLSVYGTEAYYQGPASRLRRFTYRTDGFVEVRASEGELLTRPLSFARRRLYLNYAVGEGGSVRVELQDAAGQPQAGWTLDACTPLTGDEIAAPVSWTGDGDLQAHQGQPRRLRVVLKNAAVYALQFRD